MGEDWLALVGRCLDAGKRRGMKVWLYDEYNWPSGSCKGRVPSENPEWLYAEYAVWRNPDGTFRFFVAFGRALDKPKQFFGTSVVIETVYDSYEIISESVKEGWEPHYVVIFDDVADELEMLAHMFNSQITKYSA
jgi:hypothetical protein